MEPLDPVEVRVLGCLVEKDLATPEYYPMTLNALVNACNQKSNREPVVAYEEHDVADAIDRLRAKGLVGVLTGGSNRVPKYSHRIGERLNLGRRELSLLCELLLRGPQTPGELRSNVARMHRFSDLEEVDACARTLAGHSAGPLTTQLPRQPGRKEARYAHLLSGEPDLSAEAPAGFEGAPRSEIEARVETLERELRELKEQFDVLRRELGA